MGWPPSWRARGVHACLLAAAAAVVESAGSESDDEVDRQAAASAQEGEEGRTEGGREGLTGGQKPLRETAFCHSTLARRGADDDRLQIGSFPFLCSGPVFDFSVAYNKLQDSISSYTAVTDFCSTSIRDVRGHT